MFRLDFLALGIAISVIDVFESIFEFVFIQNTTIAYSLLCVCLGLYELILEFIYSNVYTISFHRYSKLHFFRMFNKMCLKIGEKLFARKLDGKRKYTVGKEILFLCVYHSTILFQYHHFCSS